MVREYHKWFSKLLQRNMELLVFGHAGRAVLFFPTRTARFYDFEDWGVVGAVKDKIDRGELQLFCVDSIDAESIYNNKIPPADRIKRHLQYEQYIRREVLPFMHSKNKGGFFEVAGCSVGAYHAMNFALKNPFVFKKAVCMSGRYDLTVGITNFNDLFDGYNDANIAANMPQQFVPEIENENILNAIRHMDIILAIGKEDPFLPSNQELSQKLNEKKIANKLYVWDGYAHKPFSWKQMVRIYL